jgi:hypothetical protein
MSEFWVSKVRSLIHVASNANWIIQKRYWCKYCGISIADDAPSRQHHEGGLRHKGNVERHIRDIYKTSEKRKKDAAEEEREIRRIDAVRHSLSLLLPRIDTNHVYPRLPEKHTQKM